MVEGGRAETTSLLPQLHHGPMLCFRCRHHLTCCQRHCACCPLMYKYQITPKRPLPPGNNDPLPAHNDIVFAFNQATLGCHNIGSAASLIASLTSLRTFALHIVSTPYEVSLRHLFLDRWSTLGQHMSNQQRSTSFLAFCTIL